jgi:hypothetical protein
MTSPDGSILTTDGPKLSFTVGKPGSGSNFEDTVARTHNLELVVKDGVGKLSKTQVGSLDGSRAAGAELARPPGHLLLMLAVARC